MYKEIHIKKKYLHVSLFFNEVFFYHILYFIIIIENLNN